MTKGAPHILEALEPESDVTREATRLVAAFGQDGLRCLAVSVSEDIPNVGTDVDPECTWHLQGLLTFLGQG